jgi:transcriptional regulator with GAF, ATPase, and Fis domain
VKGSFSGAVRDRKGRFLAASGGTLFLDEIAEMSPACQAKILRVLQEKTFFPVGSDKPARCDTRIIVATNRDLLKQIENGKFREDLYYRLCGIEIHMPPLRERPEDIPLLAIHFLKRVFSERKNRDLLNRTPRLSGESLDMLVAFGWPGNVRQLEQAILAAVTVGEDAEIKPDDFPSWLHEAIGSQATARKGSSLSRLPSFDQCSPIDAAGTFERERELYLEALESTKYPGIGRWNIAAASRRLGILRKTFAYRMKILGLRTRTPKA